MPHASEAPHEEKEVGTNGEATRLHDTVEPNDLIAANIQHGPKSSSTLSLYRRHEDAFYFLDDARGTAARITAEEAASFSGAAEDLLRLPAECPIVCLNDKIVDVADWQVFIKGIAFHTGNCRSVLDKFTYFDSSTIQRAGLPHSKPWLFRPADILKHMARCPVHGKKYLTKLCSRILAWKEAARLEKEAEETSQQQQSKRASKRKLAGDEGGPGRKKACCPCSPNLDLRSETASSDSGATPTVGLFDPFGSPVAQTPSPLDVAYPSDLVNSRVDTSSAGFDVKAAWQDYHAEFLALKSLQRRGWTILADLQLAYKPAVAPPGQSEVDVLTPAALPPAENTTGGDICSFDA